MSKNRGVVYLKPGVVEVRDIADPKFEDPHGRKINHAVILKIVSTNICGSDQHMVRGRTTAPSGLVLGHEITGEVIEKGVDVEFLDLGDIVSVPFNVACDGLIDQVAHVVVMAHVRADELGFHTNRA